jgi:hypothetical protein
MRRGLAREWIGMGGRRRHGNGPRVNGNGTGGGIAAPDRRPGRPIGDRRPAAAQRAQSTHIGRGPDEEAALAPVNVPEHGTRQGVMSASMCDPARKP